MYMYYNIIFIDNKLQLQGIRDRDEFVFTEVKAKRGIPIVMLTSGGLQVYLNHFPHILGFHT